MTNIVLDVTPTPGSTGGYSVSMATGPGDTSVSISSDRGDVHRTLPFGYETLSRPDLQDATIQITNDGRTMGTVLVREMNAAIAAGNGSILSNYAQALLNGDDRNFPTFVREEQVRLEKARREFQAAPPSAAGTPPSPFRLVDPTKPITDITNPSEPPDLPSLPNGGFRSR